MAGKKNHVYTVLYWFFCSLFSLSLSALSLSTSPFSSAILKCHTHTHLNSYLYTQIPMLIKYFCCWIIFFFWGSSRGEGGAKKEKKNFKFTSPCLHLALLLLPLSLLLLIWPLFNCTLKWINHLLHCRYFFFFFTPCLLYHSAFLHTFQLAFFHSIHIAASLPL